MSNKKKFYITTSIAYTNAPPHIGFALELVQADVLARYRKSLGEDVFFLTGTDENGLKNYQAAQKIGKTPQEFVDIISIKFKDLAEKLNLSNNDFIRTTDQKRHWPIAQKIWLTLKENGDIYKKKYKGLYCVGCEVFVKEKDLVSGKCPLHLKEPETIEEENYFFKLSKYASQVKDLVDRDEIKITPTARKNEILSFINQGVEDVSCSRSRENLKWGVPVPDDDSQIIYIWFEALTNYLFPKKYWPADIHCVGKDIFRFHALMWPAMLIAAGLPVFKNILVHGFITSAGQKMSKSLGNVISPFELIEKYGVDAVRYFLLREISSTEDGDFTQEKFEQRYNADLASGLGNLVARVVALARKFKIPAPKGRGSLNEIERQINKTRENYEKALEELKFNEALTAIWELISFCDKYINDKKPWEETKDQKEVIGDLLSAIGRIAELLKPFLPETAEKISKQLKTLKSKPLFPRI